MKSTIEKRRQSKSYLNRPLSVSCMFTFQSLEFRCQILPDFVFDGDPATPRKGHTHPTQFLAHVYCGQTAGWMKTTLGTEVDLGPGHIVLDGVLALRKRGTAAPSPSFRPMSIVATVAHLSYY